MIDDSIALFFNQDKGYRQWHPSSKALMIPFVTINVKNLFFFNKPNVSIGQW